MGNIEIETNKTPELTNLGLYLAGKATDRKIGLIVENLRKTRIPGLIMPKPRFIEIYRNGTGQEEFVVTDLDGAPLGKVNSGEFLEYLPKIMKKYGYDEAKCTLDNVYKITPGHKSRVQEFPSIIYEGLLFRKITSFSPEGNVVGAYWEAMDVGSKLNLPFLKRDREKAAKTVSS